VRAHAGLTGPFALLEFPERTESTWIKPKDLGGRIYMEKDREVRLEPRHSTGNACLGAVAGRLASRIQKCSTNQADQDLRRVKKPYNTYE